MSAIREQKLRRRACSNETREPAWMRLGVYDCTEPDGAGWFELRGEDSKGRVHFRFADPRRLIVLDEFDATLADLERSYDRVE